MPRYLAVITCSETYTPDDMTHMVEAGKKLTEQLTAWLKKEDQSDPVLTVVLPAGAGKKLTEQLTAWLKKGVKLTIQKVGDDVSDLEEVRVTYERSPKAPW